MEGATIATWVGVGLIAISSIGTSIFTLVRTDRQRSKANGKIEEQLKNLKETSEDCSEEIKKVSKSIGAMKEHCASMTATFSAQITNLQRDVDSQKE